MITLEDLATLLTHRFAHKLCSVQIAYEELTLGVARESLREICLALREDEAFEYRVLLDICGVDYLHYGMSEWQTRSATATGFERGVTRLHTPVAQISPIAINHPSPREEGGHNVDKKRFASVYHLLSLKHNQRLRIKVFLSEHDLKLPSIMDIWPAANWFEREAFDLFGIIYEGHPDLRRLLTDYGFVGHPFRKDFPLIGKVEARYDAAAQKVIYEPVSIKERILEPKVIRDVVNNDNGSKP